MAYARLDIGEETSGKLVSVVRSNAKKLAEKFHKNLIIIDGPPGTGQLLQLLQGQTWLW